MSQRIRILELRSVRGTGGGPEKTIMLGAALADRARFDVTVCYIRDRRDDVFRLDGRASTLPIQYIEVHERHSFDMAIWSQLKGLVREHHIDIVHAHEYKTDAIAYLLGRRTGVIPMATAHAWTGNTARERYVYYPVDKRLLARFPRVIAVSTQIKDELVRHGASADRITVMLNSIDSSAFKRADTERVTVRQELGFAPTDVVIGAVGRLEPQKRFDLFLDAGAALIRRYPDVRLAIVGDGSLLAELTHQIGRLSLETRARLLGHRDDIARVHHAFDLFVQSSDYEGTPNAVLEAMAMETPVIATDVGGTRELAFPNEHATIIPKGDLPALESAIEAALVDPRGARTRALAARRRVEKDLSFDARTRRLETIYDELMQQRAPHA